MKFGENILRLRKKRGLSQEMLAEKLNVTRQTISNWELGETTPNLEQLKLLSKIFSTSIDEMLDNDVKEVLVEKVSNTEQLAGIIIKILKFIGISFIVLLVIELVAFIIFASFHKSVRVEGVDNIEMICSIKEDEYVITVGSDGYFNCSNCQKEIQRDLKDKYIDFGSLEKTEKNISNYFEHNGGSCE